MDSDSGPDDASTNFVVCELLNVLSGFCSGFGFDSACVNDGSVTWSTLVADSLILSVGSTLRDWKTILVENIFPTRFPADFSFCASVAGLSFSIMWQVTQTLVLTSKWFCPLTCEWHVVQFIGTPSEVSPTCFS